MNKPLLFYESQGSEVIIFNHLNQQLNFLTKREDESKPKEQLTKVIHFIVCHKHMIIVCKICIFIMNKHKNNLNTNAKQKINGKK